MVATRTNTKMSAKEVLASVDLLEVAIQQLGFVLEKKNPNCYKAKENLLRQEKTSSLFFYADTQRFKDYGATGSDSWGDAINLVARMKGCSLREAMDALWGDAKPKIAKRKETHSTPETRQDAHSEALPFDKRIAIYQAFLELCNDSSEVLKAFSMSKGISLKTLHSVGVVSVGNQRLIEKTLLEQFSIEELQAASLFTVPSDASKTPKLWAWNNDIVFPFQAFPDDTGKPICYYMALRHSNNEKRLMRGQMPANPYPAIYNIEALKTAKRTKKEVYLCESITDCLALIENGFLAIACMGKNAFKKHMLPYFADVRLITAFDIDAAKETNLLAKMFIENGFEKPKKLVIENGKDVCELFAFMRTSKEGKAMRSNGNNDNNGNGNGNVVSVNPMTYVKQGYSDDEATRLVSEEQARRNSGKVWTDTMPKNPRGHYDIQFMAPPDEDEEFIEEPEQEAHPPEPTAAPAMPEGDNYPLPKPWREVLKDVSLEWVIEGIAARQMVTLVHGAEGIGKTYWLLMQAMKLGMPALIVMSEGIQVNLDRMEAIALHGNIEQDSLSCIPLPLDLSNEHEVEERILDWKKFNFTLVAFDILSDMIGRSDENSATAMKTVIRSAKRIAQELNCAVILIHHNNKSGDFRGSTVHTANTDFVFAMSEKGEGLQVINRKNKALELLQPQNFGFITVKLPNGNTNRVIVPSDMILTDGRMSTLYMVCNAIYEADTGLTLKQLTNATHITKNTLANKLKEFVENGYLTHSGRGKPYNMTDKGQGFLGSEDKKSSSLFGDE